MYGCVLYAVLMIKLCVSLIIIIIFTACVLLKVNFLTMTSTLMYYGAPLTFTETILAGMAGRFSANMVAMP